MAQNREDIAVKIYSQVRSASDRTWNSIVSTVASSMSAVMTSPILELTAKDELDLYHFGEKPEILYLIYDGIDTSKNSFLSIHAAGGISKETWDLLEQKYVCKEDGLVK